jgi:hypothetical protein
MKRFFVAVAAMAAVCLLAAPIGSAFPGSPANLTTILDGQKYCPAGVLVINVTQPVVADADSSALGTAWAAESYTRSIQIQQVGSNLFCGSVTYSGTFTTLGGRSPQGTGFVGAGVTGTLSGGIKTTVFKANFRPLAPRSGALPTVYFGCDASFNCPGFSDWTSLYFDQIRDLGADRWQWVYRTAANGNWANSYAVNYYDITGGY